MISAYCDALVAAIKTSLSLDAKNVAVMLDGQPPPWAGEEFIAVHQAYWQNGDPASVGLSEEVGIDVTITRKAGFSPKDEYGAQIWRKATTGIEAHARKIIKCAHMNYTTFAAANTLITTGDDKFHHPLKWLSTTAPQLVGPDWFSSYNPPNAQQPAHAGIVVVVHFGGAARVQTITLAE